MKIAACLSSYDNESYAKVCVLFKPTWMIQYELFGSMLSMDQQVLSLDQQSAEAEESRVLAGRNSSVMNHAAFADRHVDASRQFRSVERRIPRLRFRFTDVELPVIIGPEQNDISK